MKSNLVCFLSVVFMACVVLSCCTIQEDHTTFYFASGQITVECLDESRIGIVYKDVSGRDVEIEADLTGSDRPLYDEGGVVLVVTAKGEVYYTWPAAGGTKTYAINPKGMAVQHEQSGGDNTYTVLFIDQSTGCVEYTAHIVKIDENWFARFEAPISEDVPVYITTDFYSDTTYQFDYDNLAGNGLLEFQTNPGGTITRTDLMHY
jgi:hypothetical protein